VARWGPGPAARRSVGALDGAGGIFGNPHAPEQGAINATNPASLTDPGPQNSEIADQFPAANSPTATDTNDLPQFWASFNNAAKRIQNGGWARQVSRADFAIPKTITGVDMRLTAGGVREVHWPDFAEWAYVIYGTCRITVLDPTGHAYVADVNEGELWFFQRAIRIRCKDWVRTAPNSSSPSIAATHPSSARFW
jgi:oxalate decarboxylase